MTVKEQAHSLIDSLPNDSVRAVVEILIRMKPQSKTTANKQNIPTPKMIAYLELEKLRKEGEKYSFSDDDRAAAVNEKYGSFTWKGEAQ